MSTPSEKNFAQAQSQGKTPESHRILYSAAAIIDHRGPQGQAMLVEFRIGGSLPVLLAIGSREEVARHPGAPGAERVDLPASIILPGLVNTHTHLDLTHIGPRPHNPEDGFLAWIGMIRTERLLEESAASQSIARGAALSLAGGTVAVGDIAGALPGNTDLAGWRALRNSGLLGVSYQELFGIGNRVQSGWQRLESLLAAIKEVPRRTDQLRVGIQPHAPYSVDLDLYEEVARHAARAEIPLATHLAESREERDFVKRAAGPFRDMLEQMGIWDVSALRQISRGSHPSKHLKDVLSKARFTVAHVNDADDNTIEVLNRTATSVAYCPRASEYFGAPQDFGPHRYREMLQAGVNVALGTDSLVNLPPEAADPARGGMSILDEMRVLFGRDSTPPAVSLAMATVNGARALGIPVDCFEFRSRNELAGAISVPVATERGLLGSTWNAAPAPDAALQAVLRGRMPPELLFLGNRSRLTRISTREAPPTSRLDPP